MAIESVSRDFSPISAAIQRDARVRRQEERLRLDELDERGVRAQEAVYEIDYELREQEIEAARIQSALITAETEIQTNLALQIESEDAAQHALGVAAAQQDRYVYVAGGLVDLYI